MEHLSAEERACLMYLEETIEALEVQDDSGLSNDEEEPVSLEEKLSQIRVEGRRVFHAVTPRTSLGHMVEMYELCLSCNFFSPQMSPVSCLNLERAIQKTKLNVELKTKPQNQTLSSTRHIHTPKCCTC